MDEDTNNVLLDLSESLLISSKHDYRHYTYQEICDLVYLYILTLRILECERLTRRFAHGYMRRSRVGPDFSKWIGYGSDFYNLMFALSHHNFDYFKYDRDRRNQGPMTNVPPYLIIRWMDVSMSGLGDSNTGVTARLFAVIDRTLGVNNTSMKACRRMVQDWPNLPRSDRKLVMTRLIQMLRARASHGEIYPVLLKLALHQNLLLANAYDQDNSEVLHHNDIPAAAPKKRGRGSLLWGLLGAGIGMATAGHRKIVAREDITFASNIATVAVPLGGIIKRVNETNKFDFIGDASLQTMAMKTLSIIKNNPNLSASDLFDATLSALRQTNRQFQLSVLRSLKYANPNDPTDAIQAANAFLASAKEMPAPQSFSFF